jgi:hypothetical protein
MPHAEREFSITQGPLLAQAEPQARPAFTSEFPNLSRALRVFIFFQRPGCGLTVCSAMQEIPKWRSKSRSPWRGR